MLDGRGYVVVLDVPTGGGAGLWLCPGVVVTAGELVLVLVELLVVTRGGAGPVGL